MAIFNGIGRWDGSQHGVTTGTDGPFVRIAVEATQGANEGEALLTPAQARRLAKALCDEADVATDQSGPTA